MRRKLCSLFLIFLICSPFVLSPFYASADPYSDTVNLQESKSIVYDKMRSYMSLSNNTYPGEYGLLFNMKVALQSSLWTDFINKDKSLGLTDTEKQHYNEFTLKYIERFNNLYGNLEQNSLNPKSIKLNNTGTNQLATLDMDTIIDINMYPYLEDLLKEVDTKYSAAKDEDKKKILDDYKRRLKGIYDIIQSAVTANNEINSVIPINKIDEQDKEPVKAWVYAPPINKLVGLLSNPKYKTLLDKGRELNESEVSGNVKASLFNDNDLRKSLVSDKLNLSTAFLAMYSASAVYRPFESVAGDTDFIEALSSMVDDKDKIIRTYRNARNYKKPLYKRDIDFDGKGKGTATRITVEQFIDEIKDGKSGILIYINGAMQKGGDANSYEYYRGDKNAVQVTDANKTEDGNKTTTDDKKETKSNDTSAGTSVLDSAEITDTDAMSVKPVFAYGKYKAGTNIYFGSVIMTNILKDTKAYSSIKDKNKRFLYINALGDIVTDDDLIIVPGSANPNFLQDGANYYPYSVAFMNYYPSSVNSIKKVFSATSDRDYGKYMLNYDKNTKQGLDTAEPLDDKEMLKKSYYCEAVTIKNKEKVNLSSPKTLGIETAMKDFGSGITNILVSKRFDFSGILDKITYKWAAGFWLPQDAFFYVKDTMGLTINDRQGLAFPYTGEEEQLPMAKLIAQNMYWSLTCTKDGGIAGLNGRLDEAAVGRAIQEVFNGLPNVSAYSKNYIDSYENFVNDSSGRVTTTIRDMCKPLIKSWGDVDGVIGIKNSYQDPILGKVLLLAEKYLIYVLIALAVVILAKFAKEKIDLIYTVMVIGISVCVGYAFIKIIPIYLPSVFNMAVNNIGRQTYYDTLIMKSELYNKTYGESGEVDKNGRLILSTSSLNLYKLRDTDVDDMCNKFNLDREQLLSGNAYLLDENSGLFIEGNVLKINTDKLFYTLPITGKNVQVDGYNTYVFSSTKMAPSALDYYGPYYQINDAFIDKLNKFTKTYEVPRATLQYAKNFYKDSFVVNSYVNSSVFLTPGDFTFEQEVMDPETLNRVKTEFPGDNDFLGISSFLLEPTAEMKETLWYQTLEQNGYTKDPDKMNKLIESVNFKTKKFIIDIKGQIPFMSDENVIKVISLYAWCCFNEKASEYNNYMYPLTLNYEELKLNDIMLPVFTSDYDRFISQNLDLVNYMAYNFNWFNLCVFTFTMLESFLIINIVKFAIPILYLSLAFLLVVRLLVGNKLANVVKGYLKSNLLVFICYSLYCLTLIGVNKINYSGICIYLLFFVSSVLLYILIKVSFAILLNFSELGNEKINALVSSFVEKLGISKIVDLLKAQYVSLTEQSRESGSVFTGNDERFNQYRHDADIEVAYNDDYVLDNVVSGTRNRNRNTNNDRRYREEYINMENHEFNGGDDRYVYSSDLEEDDLDNYSNK